MSWFTLPTPQPSTLSPNITITEDLLAKIEKKKTNLTSRIAKQSEPIQPEQVKPKDDTIQQAIKEDFSVQSVKRIVDQGLENIKE